MQENAIFALVPDADRFPFFSARSLLTAAISPGDFGFRSPDRIFAAAAPTAAFGFGTCTKRLE